MTPSQLYKEEKANGKLKAEIRTSLASKALSRYEAEELIQLNVLNETDRARKINSLEIKRIAQNHNMLPSEKLDIISHLYTLNGYEVVNRDKLEVKLRRKKKFSYFYAFLWFLLLGAGLLIYVLYYLLKGDDIAVISVEDNYKEKPEYIEDIELEVIKDSQEGVFDKSQEETEEITDKEQEELTDKSDNEEIIQEASEELEKGLEEETIKESK